MQCSTTITLLSLPFEIRRQIYKELLVAHRPIGEDSASSPRANERYVHGHFLQDWPITVSILRTCYQVYDEASPVLYGQNIFGLKVYTFKGQERAETLTSYHIAEDNDPKRLPYAKILRWAISVRVSDYHPRLLTTHSSLSRACQVISKTPHLRSVEVELDSLGFQTDPRILEPLTLLRNIQNVTVHSRPDPRWCYQSSEPTVPPAYAQYLKVVMEGDLPIIHLPKMYQAFQKHIERFDSYKKMLQQVAKALEDFNFDAFIRVSEQVTFIDAEMKRISFPNLIDEG